MAFCNKRIFHCVSVFLKITFRYALGFTHNIDTSLISYSVSNTLGVAMLYSEPSSSTTSYLFSFSVTSEFRVEWCQPTSYVGSET